MSHVDPTIQTTFGSDQWHPPAMKLRKPTDPRAVGMGDSGGQRQPERPDTAREVLQRVAERALEHPPRDIQKLTASAAKFLLINLEPALRLAEELRQDSLDRPGQSMTDVLQDNRQDRAIALLTDPGR